MTTNVKLMVVLGKLFNSFQEPLNKNIEELGLSSSMYLMLAHLVNVKRAKTQTLGEAAVITSGTITHTVNKMIKLGFVEKVQDEEDKRIYWIKIKPLGREKFQTVHVEHMKFLDCLLGAFTENEKLELIKTVKYFGKSIENKMEES